jgi:hypothetical protein
MRMQGHSVDIIGGLGLRHDKRLSRWRSSITIGSELSTGGGICISVECVCVGKGLLIGSWG